MSEFDAQLLRVVTDRLSRRFPEEPGVLVQASVRVAYARLNDARVRDFLPVLVEWAAADSLRRLAA